jgi:hypothetical protein
MMLCGEVKRVIPVNWRLYFIPGPVFGILHAHLRKQGRSLVLDQGDTRAR